MAGENALAKPSASTASTVSVASAALAVAIFDVRATAGPVSVPASRARTVTRSSHVAPAASTPSEKPSVVAPATGLNVPPQPLTVPGVSATETPEGRESANAIPVIAMALAPLSTVKTISVSPPCRMVSGKKTLAKPGASAGSTVSVASATVLVPSDEAALSVPLR